MKLTSRAFEEGGVIPSLYTCEGKGIAPPLEISEVPEGIQSFVLICDDPDVPKSIRPDGIYDHWVLFNLPPETRKIDQHAVSNGREGKNTSGKNGYIGPCPPDREHRYFFKLYGLNRLLDLPLGSSKKEVEKQMGGHVIAECTLMGRYEKGKGY